MATFLLAATTPLRGTIPARLRRGGDHLAAHLPAQGVLLIEVAVDGKEHASVSARTGLSLIDVQGCVVTGDAMSRWAKFAVCDDGGKRRRCGRR